MWMLNPWSLVSKVSNAIWVTKRVNECATTFGIRSLKCHMYGETGQGCYENILQNWISACSLEKFIVGKKLSAFILLFSWLVGMCSVL